jgi:hypothetical protein
MNRLAARKNRLAFEVLESRRVMAAGVKAATLAPSWFDSHLQNSVVRGLAKADYQDGVISRSEMIGLLRQVEQLGSVTSQVLADLQTVVTTADLFGGTNYVQVLSCDVVMGNSANAHYQGQVLGNLQVGSSGQQLDKLVNKWFLGTDHPLGTSDWGPTYAYRQVSGTLFVNGAAYTDIRQGGLGDCYFLASLAETALRNPGAIQSMFIVNGDGTYTVRFMHGSKAEYVTVDGQLPCDSYGRLVFQGMGAKATSTTNELWAALAEKAYVQMNECGWIRPTTWGGGQNQYTAISGGCMYMALNQITGQATVAYTSVSTTSGFNAFVTAFNAGKSICFGSKTSPASSSVVGNHAYAVVGYSAKTQTVTLFNPWGLNNGHDSGYVTMSWTLVKKNFDWFDRTA